MIHKIFIFTDSKEQIKDSVLKKIPTVKLISQNMIFRKHT